ncbi:hypothetical protein CDAR_305121 [Caerostris darwini]|uniref:Uncharacterized protein n=1 Tax=Caerostris darwini TaxID=1538125 RepID=A0AAV4RE56_9ARAC|nr:hypothetical protein CDAR_305121 [Caerostris darwini]
MAAAEDVQLPAIRIQSFVYSSRTSLWADRIFLERKKIIGRYFCHKQSNRGKEVSSRKTFKSNSAVFACRIGENPSNSQQTLHFSTPRPLT